MGERIPQFETTPTYQPTVSPDGTLCDVCFHGKTITFVREEGKVDFATNIDFDLLTGPEQVEYKTALLTAKRAFMARDMVHTSNNPELERLPDITTRVTPEKPRAPSALPEWVHKQAQLRADIDNKRQPDLH